MINTHAYAPAGGLPVWVDIVAILAIVHVLVMLAALITLAHTPTLQPRARRRWTILAIACPYGGTAFLAHRYIYDDLYTRKRHRTFEKREFEELREMALREAPQYYGGDVESP